jgi:glycogen debranching enzyme
LLSLRSSAGAVDICFEDARTLRLRSRGVGLRLTCKHPTTLLPVDARRQRLVFTDDMGIVVSFAASTLVGTPRVVNPAPDGRQNRYERLVLELAPDAFDRTELALESYGSEWAKHSYQRTFDACVSERRAEWRTWLAGMPSVPERYAETARQAMYLNWSSLVAPRGPITREGMLMSKTWMPRIWSWDHCFCAIATAHTDPRLAFDQLMLMFDRQDALGSLPDDTDSVVERWLAPKVPIHGWALRQMLAVPGAVTRGMLEEIYHPLARWTDFRLLYRDDDGDGVLQANSGNEAADNATVFDQGVPVEAPDICAYTVVQMDVLADVARRLDRPEEARAWTAKADLLTSRMIAKLWDGERFRYRTTYSGESNPKARSFMSLMPLVLGQRLPAEIRAKLVATLRSELLTEHGLASESPASTLYEPDGYWRGPIWAPIVHLICDGLRASGELQLARELARRFCDTVQRGGFAENFDAVTGRPLRDPSYTWTSSVFLVLAHEYLDEAAVGRSSSATPEPAVPCLREGCGR